MAQSGPRPSGGKPRSGSSARRPPARPERNTRSRQTGATRAAPDIRLRILDGASAGTEYAIAGSLVRIGRGDDNDIVLPDSNASRNHAELVRDGSGRYLVRDVGSRNGILINKKKQPQSLLKNGDRVTIGSTTVEFLTDAEGEAASGGGAAKRWIVVAIGAGILGFAIVSFGLPGGGGPSQPRPTGPIVITGADPVPVPGATAAPAPGQEGVSIASLFATAQTAPPGNQKGSEVGRNQTTKAAVGAATPALNIPTGASNEKIIAAIMAEGERAYASGKLVDARAYFDRAVKLDPNCERCVNRYDSTDRQITKEVNDAMAVGVTYLDNQRWDQAIMAFEKVKFLDPDPASVNNANATAYIDDAKQKKGSGGR